MVIWTVGIVIVAFVWALSGARAAAAWGPVQAPNGRSSHVNPTPQAGGLGVVLGVGAALGFAAWTQPNVLTIGVEGLTRLALVVLVLGAIAVLGFADDVWDLPPRGKFIVLALLAMALALVAGPVSALPIARDFGLALPLVLGLAGSFLWMFTVINAANFMDGANGLLGGSMAVAFAGLAACSAMVGADGALLLSVAGVGACLGFLPLNARVRADVFLGDVGALFLGGLFGAAALMFVSAAPAGAVYLGPLLVAPLLSDVLLTQLERTRRGESLFEAHRDHAYQRRLRSGDSHRAVALGVWLQSAGCAGLAIVALVLALSVGPLVSLGALAVGVAGCCLVNAGAPRLERTDKPIASSSAARASVHPLDHKIG